MNQCEEALLIYFFKEQKSRQHDFFYWKKKVLMLKLTYKYIILTKLTFYDIIWVNLRGNICESKSKYEQIRLYVRK